MTDMSVFPTAPESKTSSAADDAPYQPVARPLPREELLQIHDLMLEGRSLEERLIMMQRRGEGYFWIGGPGEEAFNTCLGLLAKKGCGPRFDYFHLHYRSSATLLAMGAPSIDALRQMHNTATDPYSRGRNFVGHFSKREWNVVNITSPIEVQFSMAIGTAIAQRRVGGDGITIVQGGDAGTAEGDFASCLIWASRPKEELPLLMIVANNQFGISTPADTQHGEKFIANRGRAFGIRRMMCDGNDAESSYRALQEAMEYVRTERKPLILEAFMSRLYGHSSSSGSNYVETETDCLQVLKNKLAERGWREADDTDQRRERYRAQMTEWYKQVLEEPPPHADEIYDHVFADRNYVAEGSNEDLS
ncbi:MAG: thiamine pyrophosphate-dependent dehydrogenase E1 component subunit alpha [Myxococcota bacterium]